MQVHPVRSLRAAVALVATLGAATAAQAAFVNVSALVTGTHQMTPIFLPDSPTYPCGSACQYVVISSVGADDDYTQTPGPYTANAWPPAYVAGLATVGAVSKSLAVPAPPAGQVQDGGSIGVARNATVQYDSQPLLNTTRRMGVQTWKGGSGASTVSIAIRLTTPSTGAQRTYLEFTVPKLARGWQDAYYVGGPSGNQPISKQPRQLQTRSAVDVYVDGLPLWSAASNLLKPRRWSPPYSDYLNLKWGPDLDEDVVTLYLGNLPAGSQRTVSLAFRTDMRGHAATCYSDTEYGTTYQRCDSRREALTLPSMLVSSGGPLSFLSYRPAVRVYTR